MKITAQIVYCSLLAGVALPVAAVDFNLRPYIGIGGGISNLAPKTSGTGYKLTDKQDFAGKIYLGWDFSDRWAAELYYGDLGAATLENQANAQKGDLEYSVYGLSGLYHFYNSEGDEGFMNRSGWGSFVKAGIGSLSNDSDLPFKQNKDTHLMLGIGAEYYLSNGLAARIEAETFDEDMQLFSVGVLWRYGGHEDAMMSDMDEHMDMMQEPSMDVETKIEDPVIDVAPSIVFTPVIENPEDSYDSDGDGVHNENDQCPGSPAGMVANAKGCDSFSGTLDEVNFKPSSVELTREAKSGLDVLASQLLAHPSIRISLQSHTDNSGPAVHNLELSKKRVMSVVRYLMSRGVQGHRMRPEAFGESSPIVSNATAEGRKINRRMDIETIQ